MTEIPRRTTPVRWKVGLLLVAALYSVISIGVTPAAPVLQVLPPAGRYAMILPVMVAVMVWIVLRLPRRWFGSW